MPRGRVLVCTCSLVAAFTPLSQDAGDTSTCFSRRRDADIGRRYSTISCRPNAITSRWHRHAEKTCVTIALDSILHICIFSKHTYYLEEWFAFISSILLQSCFFSASSFQLADKNDRSLLRILSADGQLESYLFHAAITVDMLRSSAVNRSTKAIGKPDRKAAIAKARRVTAESSIHNRWQPFQLCKISICQIDLPREESSISNLFR